MTRNLGRPARRGSGVRHTSQLIARAAVAFALALVVVGCGGGAPRPGRGGGPPHPSQLIARAAVAFALALVVVGCGGSSTSPAAAVKTTTVNLPPSYKFDPAAIEVAKGATVTWTNNDNFTHSVQ